MRKTLTLLATAAAALTSTIGMAQSTSDQTAPKQFVHEGKTYVYTTAMKDGRTVIDGHRLPDRAPFHLVVRNNRVSGMSGGIPVSFPVAQAKGAASGVATIAN
ncbi:hypothetical protein ASE75_01995 [Sphingomonas sp. Leaf17]|uniref:hypothetical protein n=1 Tax=Sphingomonas sp. Leaf17 TaxID=1735683 RepID=UPI0006FF3CDD|nr:hypothetical protein [Sphingomonas sp. Leaf17]KQM67714.1 hypothetical protein ASE75_01995 [Sphingomonas sp. Leaf17]